MSKDIKYKNIAILGNGQLAQMLSDCAAELSLRTTSLPLPKTDQFGVVDDQEINFWVDQLKSFDAVTFEIENIPVNLLKQVNQVVPVMPSISALETAQDRLKEKSLCTKLGIPTNHYISVSSLEDLKCAVSELDLPLVLKTCRFGYDGKGQTVLKSHNDIVDAWEQLKDAKYLIAESFVDFDFEVSQVATRGQNGQMVFYPLVKNEHRDGILRESYVLHHLDSLATKAQEITRKFLEYFDYVGTFAVEFFVKGDSLLVNEMAPRVHNSGHWSINGAKTSQFENHLRAISGLELGQTNVVLPYVMMVNLIGEDVPNNWEVTEGIYPRSYGKSLRKNRKMGHINVVAESKEELSERLEYIYDQIDAKFSIKI